MARPIVHHMRAPYDGGTAVCVECGDTAEYLTSTRDQLVELEPGSLVYWEIVTPSDGVVDETFAPTQHEALVFARKLHGERASVRLLTDRLTTRED